jgi:hypothetical protein
MNDPAALKAKLKVLNPNDTDDQLEKHIQD